MATNNDRARQLYEKALTDGDLPTHFGKMLYFPPIHNAMRLAPCGTSGLQDMTAAAKLGYAPAEFQMGLHLIFDDDHRMEQNLILEDRWALEKQEQDAGFDLLHKAADQGHAEAMLVIGDMFYTGFRCVEHDDVEALRWYSRAADLHYMDAYYRKGAAFYYGRGVEVNDDLAFLYFDKARKAGSRLMWAQLADCYMNGRGTKVNAALALDALEQASASSDVHKRFAVIYLGGLGFEYADFSKAKDHLAAIRMCDAEYEDMLHLRAMIPNLEKEYAAWRRHPH